MFIEAKDDGGRGDN